MRTQVQTIVESWIDFFHQLDSCFNLNSKYTDQMVDFVSLLMEQSYTARELEKIFFFKFIPTGIVFEKIIPQKFYQARNLANAMIVCKLIGKYYHPSQYGKCSSVLMEFVSLITAKGFTEDAMTISIPIYYRYYIALLSLAIVSFLECIGIQRCVGWEISLECVLGRMDLERKYPSMLVSEENRHMRRRVYDLLGSGYVNFDRGLVKEIESFLL